MTARPDVPSPVARLRELGESRYAAAYDEVRIRPLSAPETARVVRAIL